MAQASEASRNKPETFHLTSDQAKQLPQQAQIALQQVDNLKYFLISAPVDWNQDQYIRRFMLPTGEYVSCVLWANLFHITGTDIVRCLSFRFHAFGRPVKNAKKFEEGIFSDLRNLKAGNDASLEEPKSPFLDFLYKNNCIRTQKKQKVFYWYSVPHDRLFLDALERDLKREKSAQEPTTESKSEPSLSFEYDPSRSLYEQLTHGEDRDEDDGEGARSSPPAPASSAYMPPQRQQEQSTVSSTHDYIPSDSLSDNLTSSQNMQVAQQMPHNLESQTMNPTTTETMMNEQMYQQMGFGPVNDANMQLMYNQHGMPYQQPYQQQFQRHNSVPSYIAEPSPAPSFASSQPSYYDDNSRAVSYEPVTPPQYGYSYDAEPTYMLDGNVYYGNGYDVPQGFNTMHQQNTMNMPPPPPRYHSVPRQFPSAATQFAHIDGSPMYKQRRRGHSLAASYGPSAHQHMPQMQQQMQQQQTPTQIQPQMSAPMQAQMPSQTQAQHANPSPYAVRRPSNLQRSVSASVVPQSHAYERSMSNPPAGSTAYMNQLRETPDRSRQSSPMASVESSQPMHKMRDRYAGLMHDGSHTASHSRQSSPSSSVGAMRRARSATVSEVEPYPQRSHTCPIDACGRNFKRLEHLKRHVRTHTQEKPYQCPHCDKSFSRSDNLAQHRRTHESSNQSFDEECERSQESDTGTGVTEDAESPESITYNNTLPPMLRSMNGDDSFESYTSFGGNDKTFDQGTDDFYPAGSMGPPPLPLSVAGYGF